MNCAESEVLIHALLDGELDAGHGRDVEAHVAACPDCAGKLAAFRRMREAMAAANLKETAPAHLRDRIAAALPSSAPRVAAPKTWLQSSRRMFLGGFASGAALSAALAAALLLTVVRGDLFTAGRGSPEQTLAEQIVSAHIRSLQQPGHLLDVQTSDEHTVKPWFDGKLDVAPPVVDLSADGFILLGGRLDYIDGNPVASVVYRRRKHFINLFVARQVGRAHALVGARTVQGYNVRHWSHGGLDYWAVSDLDPEELGTFVDKISAALQPRSPT